MKMSSITNPIIKPKFSSLNGYYTNKDKERDSHTREKKLSGNSPVTNIVYFNYNTKENEITDGSKLKPIKNSTDVNSSPKFNSNQRNHSVKKQFSGFNSTDSKFFPISQMKSVRYNNEKLSNTVEIEALRDEIFKLKVDNNKMKQDQIEIKAENKRFEEDYKKSIKVLEEILKEGGSAAHDVLNSIMRKNNQLEENLEFDENRQNTEENLDIDRAKFSLSTNTFFRLKEMFVINSLKNQINQLKQVIKKQEEEIESFKNNARITRLVKLEHNFNNSSNELAILKGEYENLKNQYEETLEKLKENFEEKNYCKMMMQKYKAQLEDAKANLKNVKENNSKLKEVRRIQDEKIVYLSKITKPSSSIIKIKDLEKELAKENQMIIEKIEFENFEAKAKELEDLGKRMEEKMKENREQLEQIESKNKKIYDNSKEIEELKTSLKFNLKEKDVLLKENTKLINDFEDYRNEVFKEKENIIEEKNRLTKELTNLRDGFIKEKENMNIDNNKLEKELECLKSQSFKEKENFNLENNNLEKELQRLRINSDKEKEFLIEEKKSCENQIESLKIQIEAALGENKILRETFSEEKNEIQRKFDNLKNEALKSFENEKLKLLQEIKEKSEIRSLQIINEEKLQEVKENTDVNQQASEVQEVKVEVQKVKAEIVLEEVQEEKEEKETSLSAENIENPVENNKELDQNNREAVEDDQEHNKSISSSSEEKKENTKEENEHQEPPNIIDANKITTSARHHSAIIKPVEPIEEVPKVPAKRLSLKAKLKDLIFDSGKIFTLRNQESDKKIDNVPAYVPPQTETIHTANNFVINVDITEEQEIDPSKNFFVQDPDAEEKKKKAQEVVKKAPAIKKMKTIERVLVERFSKFNSIEDMIDDPEINLYLTSR